MGLWRKRARTWETVVITSAEAGWVAAIYRVRHPKDACVGTYPVAAWAVQRRGESERVVGLVAGGGAGIVAAEDVARGMEAAATSPHKVVYGWSDPYEEEGE